MSSFELRCGETLKLKDPKQNIFLSHLFIAYNILISFIGKSMVISRKLYTSTLLHYF